MISVICSTRSRNEAFEKMLRRTSGVNDIEVLIYENNNEYSLTELYNKGLNESKNNIVVFLHDDIDILTKDWGKKLLKHYETTDFGILGVAGSRNLNKNGVWWSHPESMYGLVSHTDGVKTWESKYSQDFGNDIKEVVVVDGVFFSCNKERIFKQFNEEYKGFHFYDISFCFENFKEGVLIGCIFNIKILHKSVGETNEQWEKNRLLFVENEKDKLPMKSYLDIYCVDTNIKFKNEPKLAIIIPTKNNVDELLIPCLKSIIENTSYQNYTIYIADTGSSNEELEKTKLFINNNYNVDKIKVIEYDHYHFASINNDVVKYKIDTDTELVLFCNNDIEMVNDAISLMVKAYQDNKNVGTVGCRLHYDDGSIQHLGITLRLNDKKQVIITHSFLNWDFDNTKGRLKTNVMPTYGNTAAFLLMNRNLFEEIGGFNEAYNVCFEDVELNLECVLRDKINYTLTNAVCYHLESQTRGRSVDNVDAQRIVNFIDENDIFKLKNK